MKRNPRKLKWTKAYRRAAGKELTVDSTLLFGAKRNVPIRYDRELVAKTVKAMERISEIRARRERAFYKKRMAGKRAREVAVARKLVAENEHLLPRMRGSEKRRLRQLAEERGVAVEDLEEEGLAESMAKSAKKSKVFGAEVRRLRVRTDGGVEEITDRVEGTMEGLDEEEDDDEDEEDDDMDMD
jgi:large subunit ribosomal protein L24e